MTENKRYVQFEFPYDEFAVKDNKTNEELWNPKVVDRLNEQEELIKRLKTIREEQTETILKQKRKIKELEEENKRLQIDIMGQSEEIEILSDENEKLKQPKYVFGIYDGKMTEKRFHYDYKTGRMKDTQSNSQATKDMRVLETIINNACYSYEKKIKELEQENKMLKTTISRNEAYIKRVTMKGKWSNTGDMK